MPPTPVPFQEIFSAIQSAQTFLVASHLRPDGDALGSTLAMTLWLTSCGKKVTAWNEDGVPEKFRYLPGHQWITRPENHPCSFDGVIALDTSTFSRLGTVLPALGKYTFLINIDHHVSNQGFGSLNHIDPTAPATGQILFDFLVAAGATLTPEIATNLFAAISTDTGSFQYSQTSAHTFEVAAHLLRSGVRVAELSQAMYDKQPRRRLNLLRHALNQTEFSYGDSIASFSLSRADVEVLQILPEDNEGIIDHLRSVEGVRVAVFFEELLEGKVRISARSKDPRIDVCKICAQFGGGGHALASGAQVTGPLKEVRTQFLTAIAKHL